MKKLKYIVTHGGKPHLDDAMACALVMCAKGKMQAYDPPVGQYLNDYIPVYRRDPTAGELKDPAVVVVDVGGRYEPGLSNFDHHQLERTDRRCAMLLVASHIRVPGTGELFAEVMPKVFPWWDTAITIDQQGPFQAARNAGLEWKQITPFIGPLAEVWLERWAKMLGSSPATEADHRGIATVLLSYWINEKIRAYRDVEKNLVVRDVDGFKVMDFTGCNPETCEAASAAFLPDKGVAVFVARPRRSRETWDNTGLTLMRCGDDRRVDFTKVKDHPRVKFAHAGGFLAQMSGRDMDEAMRLIRIATGKAGS